jgi:hypothetical protein
VTILYTGINPRYQAFNWLPDGLNVMYSAAGFWDTTRKRIRDGRFLNRVGLRFLDCGGFTLLNRHGDYPFMMAAYANIVARLKPHYYASMDYPCEPEITRSLALTSNRERIAATVANAQRLTAEFEMMLPDSTLVPVVQGWTLDEYKHCLDLYHAAGVIRPYMAIGSMCTRSNNRELARIIPALHEYAMEAGAHWLHFFGLKMSPVTMELDRYIYSRDSAAVLFANSADIKARWGGRFPRTAAHKREAFGYFFRRASEAELMHDTAVACPDCYSLKVVPATDEFPERACADCGCVRE